MRFSFLKIHVAFVNIFNIQDNYMFQSIKRRLLLNEGSSAPWATPSFNYLQQMNIRLEEVRQTMTTAVNEKQNESLQDAPSELGVMGPSAFKETGNLPRHTQVQKRWSFRFNFHKEGIITLHSTTFSYLK